MDKQVKQALKQLNFRWKAKHLNHIVENIVFKKRNISFLAINALFRQKTAKVEVSVLPFVNSYIISDFVPVQKNDNLRKKAEILLVAFSLDGYRPKVAGIGYQVRRKYQIVN